MQDDRTPEQIETARRQAEFLRLWPEVGFKAACEGAGITLSQPSEWTERDADFRKRRARVEEVIADLHENTLDRIARGEERGAPVQVQALAIRLRALRPHRYRDTAQRVELTGANGGAVRVEDGSASRALEFLARFAATRRVEASAPLGRLPAPPDASDASGGIVDDSGGIP